MKKFLDAIKIGLEVLAHLELVHKFGGPIPFHLKTNYRGKRMVTTGETRAE